MDKLKSFFLSEEDLGDQLTHDLHRNEVDPIEVNNQYCYSLYDLLDSQGMICEKCDGMMSPLEPSDTQMYCNRCYIENEAKAEGDL